MASYPERQRPRAPLPSWPHAVAWGLGAASFAIAWIVSAAIGRALAIGLGVAVVLSFVAEAVTVMRAPPDEPPRRPG